MIKRIKHDKQNHHPWGCSRRKEECHDYSGSHKGCAKGRMNHKRNKRRQNRRKLNRSVE